MSNKIKIEHGGTKCANIKFEKNEFYIADKGNLDEVIVRCTETSSSSWMTFEGEVMSGIEYGKFEYSDSWTKRAFEPFTGKVIFESNLEKEDE